MNFECTTSPKIWVCTGNKVNLTNFIQTLTICTRPVSIPTSLKGNSKTPIMEKY